MLVASRRNSILTGGGRSALSDFVGLGVDSRDGNDDDDDDGGGGGMLPLPRPRRAGPLSPVKTGRTVLPAAPPARALNAESARRLNAAKRIYARPPLRAESLPAMGGRAVAGDGGAAFPGEDGDD